MEPRTKYVSHTLKLLVKRLQFHLDTHWEVSEIVTTTSQDLMEQKVIEVYNLSTKYYNLHNYFNIHPLSTFPFLSISFPSLIRKMAQIYVGMLGVGEGIK